MHPSGVSTVMFTDLEASTDTVTRLGDEHAARLFAAHDLLVREQVAAHGGRVVRSTGDGFLVLFDSARGAVACALAIQAGQGEEVRVRIGLNAGEVQAGEDEALYGAAINLAARVMNRARGGEILVTDTVRQLAGTLPDARFSDRGRPALKGFPDRRRLFELRPADGPAPTRPRPGRWRRPKIAAAALAAAAALVATAAVLISTQEADAVDVRPNSVAIIDPAEGRASRRSPSAWAPPNSRSAPARCGSATSATTP